jgi:hypothetical protein
LPVIKNHESVPGLSFLIWPFSLNPLLITET